MNETTNEGAAPAPVPVKVKREKPKSRAQRWAEAVQTLRDEMDQLSEQKQRIEDAVDELRSIQEEYQEWRDNLPDNLSGSAMAEKLDAITEIGMDVEVDIQGVEELVDAAESAELPLGFGRD